MELAAIPLLWNSSDAPPVWQSGNGRVGEHKGREGSCGSPLRACHASTLAATAASTNALRASSGLPCFAIASTQRRWATAYCD